jgi:hypothetical protein
MVFAASATDNVAFFAQVNRKERQELLRVAAEIPQDTQALLESYFLMQRYMVYIRIYNMNIYIYIMGCNIHIYIYPHIWFNIYMYIE